MNIFVLFCIKKGNSYFILSPVQSKMSIRRFLKILFKTRNKALMTKFFIVLSKLGYGNGLK